MRQLYSQNMFSASELGRILGNGLEAAGSFRHKMPAADRRNSIIGRLDHALLCIASARACASVPPSRWRPRPDRSRPTTSRPTARNLRASNILGRCRISPSPRRARLCDMAYMDVKPAAPNGSDRRAVARQEFLRGNLAGHHRGPERSRLSRDRPRPDRVLQIDASPRITSTAFSSSPETRTRCWLRSA